MKNFRLPGRRLDDLDDRTGFNADADVEPELAATTNEPCIDWLSRICAGTANHIHFEAQLS